MNMKSKLQENADKIRLLSEDIEGSENVLRAHLDIMAKEEENLAAAQRAVIEANIRIRAATRDVEATRGVIKQQREALWAEAQEGHQLLRDAGYHQHEVVTRALGNTVYGYDRDACEAIRASRNNG